MALQCVAIVHYEMKTEVEKVCKFEYSVIEKHLTLQRQKLM